MTTPTKQRKPGPQAIRQRALDAYYKDPSICKHCGNVIRVSDTEKPAEARRKTFCNHSCAASYNNIGCRRHPPRPQHPCIVCGAPTSKPKCCSKKCRDANLSKLEHTSYSWLVARDGWRSARARIQKLARSVYKRSKRSRVCRCGYALHTDIAHIRAVADFPDDTLIKVINDPDNLTALCPNCHWEYDNGLLDLTNL